MKWTVYEVQISADGHPSPRVLPPFNFTVGPTPRTKQVRSPLDVFNLFVTVVLLESIVTQTILFAKSKKASFSEFYLEELQAFIGIHIAMGLLKLPQIKDYWCTNEIISTNWFPTIMTRDRLFAIMRFLPIQHSKGNQVKLDMILKVCSVIDHFSAVFPRYCQPSREISK